MRFIIFLTCFCLHFTSFSQLSGTYTVGHAGDDYPEIDSAMNALQTEGISGLVTLLISDGEYEAVNLTDFQPASGDSLIIRSASGNPALVQFSSGRLWNIRNVTLQDLGFYKSVTDHLSLLIVTRCDKLKITGCRIEYNPPSDNGYHQSALKIEQTSNLPLTDIFIDSCFISSSGEFVVNESGTSGRIHYTADTIIGTWQSWHPHYREFTNCYLETNGDPDAGGTAFFRNCIITLTNSHIYMHAAEIDACHIDGINAATTLTCPSIVNSVFDVAVSLYGENINVIDNLFHQFFSGSYALFGERNTFFDYTYIQERSVMVNNFFLDTAWIRGEVYHNNFGPNSLFQYNGNNGNSAVQYNNIHRFSGIGSNPYMFGNNFSADDEETLNHAFFDSNPTFYNPGYVGTQDLHIQNPVLFSRGSEVSVLATQDIDDETRFAPTSIGADETCLQLPLRDTLFLECGSTYQLKTCASLDGFQWKPDSVIGGTAEAPTVLVNQLQLVWLEDVSGNKIDSMYLSPLPLFGGGKRTFDIVCGQTNTYATYVPNGGTISWQPGSVANDSIPNQVVIATDSSMLVIARVDMGVCGVKLDTLELIVDPAPVSSFAIDSASCSSIYFHSNLLCYDSLSWDFRDGTKSTDATLSEHFFPFNGTFNILLTVWHEGISRASELPAYMYCNNIPLETFKIYPNPVNQVLSVEFLGELPVDYHIFDESGRLLKEGIISFSHSSIDVGQLYQGIYFLSVDDKQELFLKE